MRAALLALMWLLSLGPLSAAGIYKWVDEQGRVHYTDKPPKATAEEMNIKTRGNSSAALSDAERRERQQRLLNLFEQERAEARQKREQEKQRKTELARNCALALDRLRNLERASYLYELDDQGNRIVLPNDQRDQEIKQTKQFLAQQCKA